MLTLDQALEETRTGDLWLFRGGSRPDRAIQTLTNSPVNHVGMTVAIDDLPPLIWHAELGDKLVDLWTGTNHRGVQLHDLQQAVLQWTQRYHQRCWLRQLTPHANREQENKMLRVIARMDGTPFPSTARVTGRWFRGRVPTAYDWTRGIPFVDKKVRESTQRRKVATTRRPGNRVLRRDGGNHLRGDGTAQHGEVLVLVRPGLVLERRHASAGARLPAGRRNRGLGRPGRLIDRHRSCRRPPRRIDRLTDDLGRPRPGQLSGRGLRHQKAASWRG